MGLALLSSFYVAKEMCMPNPDILIEKTQALPPERLAEVEDFMDFLSAKSRRLGALDRLLAIAPALEKAGAPEISEDELQAEIDAVLARPARGKIADRS